MAAPTLVAAGAVAWGLCGALHKLQPGAVAAPSPLLHRLGGPLLLVGGAAALALGVVYGLGGLGRSVARARRDAVACLERLPAPAAHALLVGWAGALSGALSGGLAYSVATGSQGALLGLLFGLGLEGDYWLRRFFAQRRGDDPQAVRRRDHHLSLEFRLLGALLLATLISG